MSEASEPATRRSARFRWKPGAVIVASWLVVLAVVWFFIAPSRTWQILSAIYLSPVFVVALAAWWIGFSGLSRAARSAGAGVLVIAVAAFFALFRYEGVHGDMLPIFSPRWRPSSEVRAAAFWKEQQITRPGSPDSSPAAETNGAASAEPEPRLEISTGDWPGFRGPRRDGVVRHADLRRNWDEHPPREMWRHPVGAGWSSFAVVGERAFTQEQHGEEEAVVCYDATTGKPLWAHTDPGRFSEALGGLGPRATPTVHDSRVYALGATGILNCLDALSGELLWQTNILEDAAAENLPWGMAGSPLVYDDYVVVNPGGESGGGVAAYDRRTGETLWAAGDAPAGYAAPRLETLRGKKQVIVFDGHGVKGHDPYNGEELWSKGWTNVSNINAAQPIVRDGRFVLISTGYGRGSLLLEITREEGVWDEHQVWDRPSRALKAKFNGMVYRKGSVYGFDDGILACIDYRTGERQWKRGRYGYGQLLLVAPSTAGDRGEGEASAEAARREPRPPRNDDVLLVQAESGEVVLVEPTPEEFRELARFEALEGKTWNHPVLHGGRLFVRNGEEAACFDVAPAGTETREPKDGEHEEGE